jgi:two-component system, chemotaxis family, chemotaxis protein CheY
MKVFIVDDTSFIRILCRHYAVKAGFDVIGEAYDGKMALDAIQTAQPDCVIMDLALPNMNGAEVIRQINSSFPQIKFIIVSALDRDFCGPQIADLSFSTFITKPFTPEQVQEALINVSHALEKENHG